MGLQQLRDKNNALDKIEQERLAKIEMLKEKFNKSFTHNNIDDWNSNECSDYANHTSVLGKLMSDQLADYKGKLDELKRKDLQSWVDSKQECNNYDKFEKSLDKDVYSNLQA